MAIVYIVLRIASNPLINNLKKFYTDFYSGKANLYISKQRINIFSFGFFMKGILSV